MAETALNETGRHFRNAVPLAAQPPLLRTIPGPNAWWPVPMDRAQAAHATLPDLRQPLTGGAEAVRQLAHAWLTALAVSGDESPGNSGYIPANLGIARLVLTRQSVELIVILLGTPFRPRQAAAVGQALVQAGFTGACALGRTLRVLLVRLPEVFGSCAQVPGGPREMEQRVAAVTEALANGYMDALRARTLAEQESIMRDLAAQRVISQQLLHQATHDALTGLPNRSAALGRLSAAIAAGGGNRIGVCYLDLDGFKGVNDRYGHHAGDELLVKVAGRIHSVADAYGTVAARMGGDEFVVLAEFSPGLAGMIKLAADLIAEVRHPVALRIGHVGVSACAGIAECAARSAGAATIVADADAALYDAKSRGPGRWSVYNPGRYWARDNFAGHAPHSGG